MRGPKRPLTPAPPGAIEDLCVAITALQSPEEARRFLTDLATPAELEAFAERWRIARLLDAGGLSYRDIAAETGASTTTIARVARFLRDEPHGGYRAILDRLAAKSGKGPSSD